MGGEAILRNRIRHKTLGINYFREFHPNLQTLPVLFVFGLNCFEYLEDFPYVFL